MSAQYREGNFQPRPAQYESLGQINDCVTCPAQCSCNLGSRTKFDQMMNLFYLNEVADMKTPGSWYEPARGNFGMLEPYQHPRR